MQVRYLRRHGQSPPLGPSGSFSLRQLQAREIGDRHKRPADPFVPARDPNGRKSSSAFAGKSLTSATGPQDPANSPPGAGTVLGGIPPALPLGNAMKFASLDPGNAAANGIPDDRKTANSGNKQGIYRRLRLAKRVLGRDSSIQICQTLQPQHFKGETAGGGVEIRAGSDGRTSYGGLFSCGNVWACPVCASRAAARKGKDVVEAMERHRLLGGRCYMVTFTVRHEYGDDLDMLLAALRQASRKFKSGRWYKQAGRGVFGSITGLEVTHGGNGWHPHTHELLFTVRKFHKRDERIWRARWKHCLRQCGLDGNEVSLKIQPASPSGYLTKWGADSELLGDASKQGAGRNPWQILDKVTEGERYADLFRDYVRAFKGRSRLRWSKGLRARLGLKDPQPPDETVVIGILTRQEWGFLVTRQAEGEFLDLVRVYGFANAYGAVFLGDSIVKTFTDLEVS